MDDPPPHPAGDAARAVEAVVIGRNEGERLQACLASLAGKVRRVVYVDSGSSDDSVADARGAGACVVELDPTRRFTAARARNAGLDALDPGTEFVQFIDGDCTLNSGWVATAHRFLIENPRVAVACGRRRERHPDASIYNRLCDWEWDTPVGPARACGGDALMRTGPLQVAGGFRDDLIAGEEPELCRRLRAAGWEVWRLDAEMTLHDAQMQRFGQWWRRSVRAGHAFAEVGSLHREMWRQERFRMWVWGVLLPALLVALLAAAPLAAMAVPALYALSLTRIALRLHEHGWAARDAVVGAALIVVSKFANAAGALRYLARGLRRDAPQIIEYR